jgi:hypothetical protein
MSEGNIDVGMKVVCYNKKWGPSQEGHAVPSYFENRRCDLIPFKPRNTVSVARRLETENVVARSSRPSCARFRFELDRVYGGCDRSSSGSGSSKSSINAGGRYGSGLGANNGALHTTWRNSGVGVGGAAVDIGDPESEGETVDAEKPRKRRSEQVQTKT